MKKFLTLALAAAALLTCSCASTKRLSPTYLPPSTTGTRVAVAAGQERVKAAQAHVTNAQNHAKSATTKIVAVEKAVADNPALLSLVTQAHNDIDQLTTELTQTQEALTSAQTSLAEAQNHATSLQLQIDDQTKTLNSTIETSNRNADKAAAATKKYHKIKLICAGLAMGLVGFLVFKFKALFVVLGPYALVPMIGLPAGAFALVWFFL